MDNPTRYRTAPTPADLAAITELLEPTADQIERVRLQLHAHPIDPAALDHELRNFAALHMLLELATRARLGK